MLSRKAPVVFAKLLRKLVIMPESNPPSNCFIPLITFRFVANC